MFSALVRFTVSLNKLIMSSITTLFAERSASRIDDSLQDFDFALLGWKSSFSVKIHSPMYRRVHTWPTQSTSAFVMLGNRAAGFEYQASRSIEVEFKTRCTKLSCSLQARSRLFVAHYCWRTPSQSPWSRTLGLLKTVIKNAQVYGGTTAPVLVPVASAQACFIEMQNVGNARKGASSHCILVEASAEIRLEECGHPTLFSCKLVLRHSHREVTLDYGSKRLAMLNR